MVKPPDLSSSSAAAGAIAGLFAVLGAGVVLGFLAYVFFRHARAAAGAAVGITFVLFFGWLSHTCEPRTPIVFLFAVLHPISVAAAGALVLFALAAAMVVFTPRAGAVGIAGPLFVVVGFAEWIVLTHWVIPYYAACGHG